MTMPDHEDIETDAGTIAGGQRFCPTARAAPSYPYHRSRRTDVTSGPKNFARACPAPD